MLAYSWRAIGPRTLARHLLAYWADPEARNTESGFDARFGTDTTAELTPLEAGLPRARRRGATAYVPTMDGDLDAMLDALGWSDMQLRQTTFVDVGSGKGRAVFVAAMRPFREAIGIELSTVLHAVAQHNLELVKRTGKLAAPVRFTLGDATAFDVPRGPLIVYLYHPFRETVATKVIDRIVASIASSPRPVAILYGHPTLQPPLDRDVFARGGLFQQAYSGARVTRHFRIGWTIWTDEAWLGQAAARKETVLEVVDASPPSRACSAGTARACRRWSRTR